MPVYINDGDWVNDAEDRVHNAFVMPVAGRYIGIANPKLTTFEKYRLVPESNKWFINRWLKRQTMADIVESAVHMYPLTGSYATPSNLVGKVYRPTNANEIKPLIGGKTPPRVGLMGLTVVSNLWSTDDGKEIRYLFNENNSVIKGALRETLDSTMKEFGAKLSTAWSVGIAPLFFEPGFCPPKYEVTDIVRLDYAHYISVLLNEYKMDENLHVHIYYKDPIYWED